MHVPPIGTAADWKPGELPPVNMNGGWGLGGSESIAPYIRNWFVNKNGVDIGCGAHKIVPWAIGVDTARCRFGAQDAIVDHPVETANLVGDGRDLSWFADGSLDFVYSSHMIEHLPKHEALDLLHGEWYRVLKPGGLMVLYLPHGALWQPKFHLWHPNPQDFEQRFQGHEKRIWVPQDTLETHQLIRHLAFSFLVTIVK